MNSPPRKRIVPEERLRGRDSLLRVFETGFSARSGRLLARFVFTDGRAIPLRFGVAVSRRISTAVMRNRCKRLLREAVRAEKEEFVERMRVQRRAADVMFVWMDPNVTAAMRLLPEMSLAVRTLLEKIVTSLPTEHGATADRLR